MENLLAGTALNEKLYAAIERFFFFLGKVTRRQFTPHAMVMQTLAAQGVLVARGMCASAIFGINANTGTLVNLSHANLQALPPQGFF
jgi:hypothetical protein